MTGHDVGDPEPEDGVIPTGDRPSDELSAAMPRLLRYARTMTNDSALADDLVQTTILRALERGGFEGRSSMSTWLHRILHNCFVDHVRRDREVPDESIWERVEERWRDPEYGIDPLLVAERASTAAEVRDALLRLPVTHRAAVVLHDMEGLTVPEVAQVQSIGLAAAKQRVRRGRMMLVDALASGAERREASEGVPLDCWHARQQISDYLDDELGAEEARLLERHLELCPTCPPMYSAVVTSRRTVSHLRDADSVIPKEQVARIAELE